MALFNTLKEKFSGSLNMSKGKSVIGLDIGRSFIKVVQLRNENEKVILETYGEIALGPYAGLSVGGATKLAPEEIVEAIKALFKETNVTANTGALSIPLDSTLLTLIEMPKMEEVKLQKAIPLEAKKYIPAASDEISLDWMVIPKRKDEDEDEAQKKDEADGKDAATAPEKVEVLIMAIHNDVLTKYNNIINGISLVNSSLEIEVFSAVRAVLSRDMSTFMVLDIGSTSTKLSIVERGVIKGSHIVGKGSRDITKAIASAKRVTETKAEELKRKVGISGEGEDGTVLLEVTLPIVDQILAEANNVILNYQQKNSRPVTKVALIGGGVLLPGFVERAQEKLSTDVFYSDAFTKVQTPEFLDSILKDAGPEFAVAVGLALRRLEDG